MKKPQKKKTTRKSQKVIRSKDVPATAGMIYELRDELIKRFDHIDNKIEGVHCELKADNRRLDKKLDGGFAKLDTKIDGGLAKLDTKIDGGFAKLDKKIDGVEASLKADNQQLKESVKGMECRLDKKIDSVESRIKADNHQVKILIEEQNARNVFTIDQLNSLYHRQERIEKKVDERL